MVQPNAPVEIYQLHILLLQINPPIWRRLHVPSDSSIAEIVTRVAVVGKRRDLSCEDFSGELYAESLDSLYNFFRECRGIMRKFPVGKLKESKQEHLGVLINRILNDVFRPFLESWNGPYRAWWATATDGRGSAYEIQIRVNFPS
jgi:hypothetical protein